MNLSHGQARSTRLPCPKHFDLSKISGGWAGHNGRPRPNIPLPYGNQAYPVATPETKEPGRKHEGEDGGRRPDHAVSRHPVCFTAQTPSLPPLEPLHRVTDQPHLNRAEGVATRITASHRTAAPAPPQEKGRGNRIGYEARRVHEGRTEPRAGKAAEPEKPREPDGKERHGAGSSTKTEAGTEH